MAICPNCKLDMMFSPEGHDAGWCYRIKDEGLPPDVLKANKVKEALDHLRPSPSPLDAKCEPPRGALGVHAPHCYCERCEVATMRVDEAARVQREKNQKRVASWEGTEWADEIQNPPHYTTGEIQPIDFIKSQGLNYNIGNVIKYASRYRHKGNPVQDLQKAIRYLEHEIESIESDNQREGS